MKDYYSILGVSKEADEVVIRAAYKALAQKYHPDKASPELKAKYTELMKEINEAYSVLSRTSESINQDLKHANESNSKNASVRKHGYSETKAKSDVNKKTLNQLKEMPNWMFGLILLVFWMAAFYLIIQIKILKN